MSFDEKRDLSALSHNINVDVNWSFFKKLFKIEILVGYYTYPASRNNQQHVKRFFFLYTIPKPIKPLSSSTMCSIINVWCFLLKHFFFFRSFVHQMNMRFIILDIYPLFIAFILSVRFYYYCDVVLNTLFQPYRILVFQFTRCENVSMYEIRFSNLSEMCVV